MSDDSKLPAKVPVEVLPAKVGSRLTGRELEIVAQAAADVGHIVKDLVSIARIRAEARGQVEHTDSVTRQLEAKVAGEISKIIEQRGTLLARGQVATAILREIVPVLKAIPDIDSETRKSVVDSLKGIMELVVKS